MESRVAELLSGYTVECYTGVEVDDTSRAIARHILSNLQEEYPSHLPNRAIWGYKKRLPQELHLVGEAEPTFAHGAIYFLCREWEFQSMSMAG